MLKPDQYFRDFLSVDIERKHRSKARARFRRAIREYYVLPRRFVYEPETGERVQSVIVGETMQQQKNQRRRVRKVFTGIKVGRQEKLEVQVLMSRLFVLWGQFGKTAPTFSWNTRSAVQTDFEFFLFDLLPKLGVNDVRGHVEKHWRARQKLIRLTLK